MEVIQQMPKIELHAHLNGSLSKNTILKLIKLKYAQNQSSNDISMDDYGLTSNYGLEQCFRKFQHAQNLTDTPKAVQLATQLVISDFAEDNVIYLELRSTPRSTDNMSKVEYLENIIQAIKSCQVSHPSISVKLIPSIDRSKGIKEAEENLEVTLNLRRVHPNIVVGLDFSGNPNQGKFCDFKPILKTARDNGLRLALHCAEIDNLTEVDEMLKFGADRLGHGTFLTDEHLKMLSNKSPNTPTIECCITSNLLTGTVSNLEDHHFKRFFEDKYPVVICTDDFGVFNTTLSNEFYICQTAFQLSNVELFKIIENSVKYIFSDDHEKNRLSTILSSYRNSINF